MGSGVGRDGWVGTSVGSLVGFGVGVGSTLIIKLGDNGSMLCVGR